jgi:hypothetical protein
MDLDTNSGTKLAYGLGLFSIGLGLTEVIAPRALARWIGVDGDDRTAIALRAAGVREIGNGVAILARPRTPATLWSRVVGDALDLGILGWLGGTRRERTTRLAIAVGAVLGVMALDVLGARKTG